MWEREYEEAQILEALERIRSVKPLPKMPPAPPEIFHVNNRKERRKWKAMTKREAKRGSA